MDLEKILLIHCLHSAKALDLVVEAGVTQDQFSTFDNQKIFGILIGVYKKLKLLTNEAILKQMLSKSTIPQKDQDNIVASFFALSICPIPDVAVEFVLDEFKEKNLKDQLEQVVKSLYGLTKDKKITQAIDLLKSSASKLSTLSSKEVLDEGYIGDDVDARLQRYRDKKANPTKFGGVSTGYTRFDTETNGLHKGHLVVVMGAQKSGKSILLLNIAHHVAKQGKRVALFVNEGGRDLVTRRWDTLDARINCSNLRDGKLSDEEEQRFLRSLDTNRLSKGFFVCSMDPQHCTTSRINSRLDELEQRDGKFDLVIIDYMGIMTSDDPYVRKEDDWKRLGSITMELKSMAMTRKVPVLTVHHVTKEGAKKKEVAYAMTDMSRSFEITKHIDLLMSWKVLDPEQFELLRGGDIAMQILISRDSSSARWEVRATMTNMLIEEKPDGFSLDHPELSTTSVVQVGS